MAFTKRTYSKNQKIIIFGSGTLAAFIVLLVSLSNLGIDVKTSGDIVCGETCVSYFNISLTNYSLCMGSTFKGIFVEPEVNYEVYKADLRYRSDNPLRWKPYNFTANTCLKKGKNYEFKLVGYKKTFQTVKWGMNLQGRDLDPFWYGLDQVTSMNMELGSQINLNVSVGAESYFEVDCVHPDYGVNFTRSTA